VRYLFEDFVLDIDRRELRRRANAVPVAPQVFDLLEYLLRHRERVVSKDDLIAAVWEQRIVSDAAVTNGRAREATRPKPGPTAVLYARVSTPEQERDGFSIPAQVQLLETTHSSRGSRSPRNSSTSRPRLAPAVPRSAT
jgi:hypothetical protein